MIIYLHKAGPLLRYSHDCFEIGDLNPQIDVQWRMSRWDMIKVGFRCIWSAVRT